MIKVLFADDCIEFIQTNILNTTKHDFLFKNIYYSISIPGQQIIIKLILPNYFKIMLFSSHFFLNKFQISLLLLILKILFYFVIAFFYSLHLLCNLCFFNYVLCFFLIIYYNKYIIYNIFYR